MDFYYEFVETVKKENGGERKCCGVLCRFGGDKEFIVDDVFESELRTRSLVGMLNSEKVEPEHFLDIIYDLLC